MMMVSSSSSHSSSSYTHTALLFAFVVICLCAQTKAWVIGATRTNSALLDDPITAALFDRSRDPLEEEDTALTPAAATVSRSGGSGINGRRSKRSLDDTVQACGD